MPVLNFTPAFIASGLVCPADKKRIEYCDADVPGLLIECRSAVNAIPTWYLRYKVNGKTAYTRLGNVQDLGLAQARKKAKTEKAQHTLAPKQAVETKAPMGSMRLDEFMRDHYFPHVKVHKRSWKRDDQLYRIRIAPKFGQLALSEINRRDVQVFQNSLLKEGLSPASADHHVKLLRRLCNLAVDWDLLEKNVLKGIPLYMVDNQVENYLSEDQMTRLMEVLRTDANRPVCLIMIYLLSTGCRLNEALKAEWKQVDIANRVWRIPATNSKSKRIRSVPLNDSAIWVLEQLGTQEKYMHVFVNKRTGTRYTSISRAWHRLRKLAGLPNMRAHDARHDAASRMSSAGVSLYQIAEVLGHSDPKVTMRYAHLSARALQDAANAASVIVRKPVVVVAQPEPAEPEAKAA